VGPCGPGVHDHVYLIPLARSGSRSIAEGFLFELLEMMAVDLQVALEFARSHRNAILTTLRADGRPQQSMIFYVIRDDQFVLSITDSRAKTKNLRRDPRASLFVPTEDAFRWAAFDGQVELSAVAAAPDDEVVDLLVDYYRNGNGEHPDWADYRRAMVAEGRLVATFRATSATGILPD
jgi:PPOX class probable F420-dependent enzyme